MYVSIDIDVLDASVAPEGSRGNARDRQGWTALKFAARRYQGQEIVDLLRKAGADE
jgi:arginase family enzyme